MNCVVAVSTSDLPPDDNHPYGHSKIENVSGILEALLILGAAAWIVYEAISKLFNPQPVSAMRLGVVVMLISALVNLLVSRHLYRVAQEEKNQSATSGCSAFKSGRINLTRCCGGAIGDVSRRILRIMTGILSMRLWPSVLLYLFLVKGEFVMRSVSSFIRP
ncbi:cation diffusion facilitator family transporter [Vibrio metschnikovii]